MTFLVTYSKEKKISRIVLGGLNFGTGWDYRQLIDLLDLAESIGIKDIEVAQIYGQGNCIATLEKALHERKTKGCSFKVSFKYGLEVDSDQKQFFSVKPVKLEAGTFKKDFLNLPENVLRNIGGVQLHCPMVNNLATKAFKNDFETLLCHYDLDLGVSNHSPAQINQLLSPNIEIDHAQFHFNVFQQSMREIISDQSARRRVWINRSMARGLLSNTFLFENAKKDYNARRYKSKRIRDEIDRNKALLKNLSGPLLSLSRSLNIPIPVLAVNYCMELFPRSKVVLGARNLEQFKTVFHHLETCGNQGQKEIEKLYQEFKIDFLREPETFFET